MKRILNKELLNNYIAKHDIENKFDKDLINQFLGTTYRHLNRTLRKIDYKM